MPPKPHPTSLNAAICQQIARIGHATANASRLELLDLLAQSPRTVEALALHAGRSVATTSHHLQVLRRARLVEAQKAGLYVTYRLADDSVGGLVLAMRRVAEARLAEVELVKRQYLHQRGALEPVDQDELVRRVHAGEVTVIDVRPPEEYTAAHIPGALSVPLADLETRLRTMSKRRDIVAYCRGPYCVMALDAIERLRRKGYRAYRMEHGVAEWRARGWRIVEGPAHPAGQRR